MTANLGKIDRAIRALLGLVLIAAPLQNLPPIWSNWIFAFASIGIGLVLVLTALFQFCPMYRLLGLSTCKID